MNQIWNFSESFFQGAARDAGAFNAQVQRGSSKPNPNSITYGGVLNENLFRASKTLQILEPFGHSATDRNGELWLGVEVVSCYDGKPRVEGTSLDLIVVIDVSGSMDSRFGQDGRSKLENAKMFTIDIAKKLWPNDEIAIIEFENKAKVVLDPIVVNDKTLSVR